MKFIHLTEDIMSDSIYNAVLLHKWKETQSPQTDQEDFIIMVENKINFIIEETAYIHLLWYIILF